MGRGSIVANRYLHSLPNSFSFKFRNSRTLLEGLHETLHVTISFSPPRGDLSVSEPLLPSKVRKLRPIKRGPIIRFDLFLIMGPIAVVRMFVFVACCIFKSFWV